MNSLQIQRANYISGYILSFLAVVVKLKGTTVTHGVNEKLDLMINTVADFWVSVHRSTEDISD